MLFAARCRTALTVLRTLRRIFRRALSARRRGIAAIAGILAIAVIASAIGLTTIGSAASAGLLMIVPTGSSAMLGAVILPAVWTFGRHKTLRTVSDQIISAAGAQRFAHLIEILRAVELQQCSLLLLFMIIGRAEDLFARQRVDARIVHASSRAGSSAFRP